MCIDRRMVHLYGEHGRWQALQGNREQRRNIGAIIVVRQAGRLTILQADRQRSPGQGEPANVRVGAAAGTSVKNRDEA